MGVVQDCCWSAGVRNRSVMKPVETSVDKLRPLLCRSTDELCVSYLLFYHQYPTYHSPSTENSLKVGVSAILTPFALVSVRSALPEMVTQSASIYGNVVVGV